MAIFEKLKDWLMPPEEDEYEEEISEVVEKKANKVETLRSVNEKEEKIAVNGTVPKYTSNSRFANTTPSMDFNAESLNERPKFKLHTANTPSLKMEVHVPQNFDHVRAIGDELKKKNAVIVNYEMLGVHDQIRICDFLNGLTYVLDGDVKRISSHIVLYVPDGVDISDMALAVA